jgi:hypothetical protein
MNQTLTCLTPEGSPFHPYSLLFAAVCLFGQMPYQFYLIICFLPVRIIIFIQIFLTFIRFN